MFKDRTISVVIPCLNEEEGIRNVIQRMPAIVDEIIVVDNGSTDNTAAIATSLGATVVKQAQKGYGRAFKTGFSHCRTDIIATADGDGTYPVEKIPELVTYLLQSGADFISGSRFPLDNVNAMTTRNFIGNMFLTLSLCVVFHVKLYDGLSGMWVFKRDVLDRLILKSNRWSLSQEIKIEACLHKTRFLEYHIPYAERIGKTKLYPFSVGIENLLFLLWHKLEWAFNIRRCKEEEGDASP